MQVFSSYQKSLCFKLKRLSPTDGICYGKRQSAVLRPDRLYHTILLFVNYHFKIWEMRLTLQSNRFIIVLAVKTLKKAGAHSIIGTIIQNCADLQIDNGIIRWYNAVKHISITKHRKESQHENHTDRQPGNRYAESPQPTQLFRLANSDKTSERQDRRSRFRIQTRSPLPIRQNSHFLQ